MIRLPDSKYVPLDIASDVRRGFLNNVSSIPPFTCPHSHRTVSLRCAATTMEEADTALSKALDAYVFTIRFLEEVLLISRGSDLDVTCICHPAKRTWPTNPGEPLASQHVNGGVTWFEDGVARVVVYRSEEMIKVLMHELIHATGACHHCDDLNASFDDRISNVSEAIVDAVACEVYTLYLQHMFPDRSVRNEMGQHIQRQSSHVCWYFTHVNPEENTNAYAYYIIKAALFCDDDGLLRLLLDATRKRDIDHIREIVLEAYRRGCRVVHPSPPSNQSLRMTPCFALPYL